MTWEAFYLACFVFGFVFAVLGFLGGALHWPISHLFHGIHLPGGHAIPTHGAAAPGHGGLRSASGYNFATAMAFLAWFGGMGYLLSHSSHLGSLGIFLAALATGCAGGAVVFSFLTRFLLRHERSLETEDFEMVGVLGRVTVPIRKGGTGEIVYSQAGTRRSSGARSELGVGIPRGFEVVVTRFDRGIAYVRSWDELAEREEVGPPARSLSPSPPPVESIE